MNRVTGSELIDLEEHLLWCERCQKRLAHEDNIRQSLRDADTMLRQAPVTAWRFPRLAWTAALFVGLLAVAGIEWPDLRSFRAAPTTILLQANRGEYSPSWAAPAGKPLVLVLDLTQLPKVSSYKLEIVDGAGNPVVQSDEVPHGNQLQARLLNGLGSGAYFIRLYGPTRELLREYSLVVRG